MSPTGFSAGFGNAWRGASPPFRNFGADRKSFSLQRKPCLGQAGRGHSQLNRSRFARGLHEAERSSLLRAARWRLRRSRVALITIIEAKQPAGASDFRRAEHIRVGHQHAVGVHEAHLHMRYVATIRGKLRPVSDKFDSRGSASSYTAWRGLHDLEDEWRRGLVFAALGGGEKVGGPAVAQKKLRTLEPAVFRRHLNSRENSLSAQAGRRG